MLRLVGREGAELRDDGDGELGRALADERAGQVAARDHAVQLAEQAPLLPAAEPPVFLLDVLLGVEYDRDAEPACGGQDLPGRGRAGLFLYLDEVGPAVAQQGFERAARVFDRAAGGQGEDFEAALALPRDVDRPAEPGLAFRTTSKPGSLWK
jgi:hypothetical protein